MAGIVSPKTAVHRRSRWSATRLVSRYARDWARRRQGRDPDPVVLRRRRIYILPTRQGVAFGVMLFVMLLGAMNYNNSMGFALTFLLAGLALVCMHHCHRNLMRLEIRSAGAEPVFAGNDARFKILLSNPSSGPRYGLTLDMDGRLSDRTDLPAGGHATLSVAVPTAKRGRVQVERFSIATRFPAGLFRAWAWVHMDLQCVVYPRPASATLTPPPHNIDTGGAQDDHRGDEDFAGLRSFRPGDSPRHIAWKAFAREQELLVKSYAGTDVTTHLFDWNEVPVEDPEARLAQLCRWILDAHHDGHAYGLQLPGNLVDANLGTGHKKRCLTALALFEPAVRAV